MIYDFIIRQVLDDTIIPQITCVGMILRGGEGERERERDRGRERVGGKAYVPVVKHSNSTVSPMTTL